MSEGSSQPEILQIKSDNISIVKSVDQKVDLSKNNKPSPEKESRHKIVEELKGLPSQEVLEALSASKSTNPVTTEITEQPEDESKEAVTDSESNPEKQEPFSENRFQAIENAIDSYSGYSSSPEMVSLFDSICADQDVLQQAMAQDDTHVATAFRVLGKLAMSGNMQAQEIGRSLFKKNMSLLDEKFATFDDYDYTAGMDALAQGMGYRGPDDSFQPQLINMYLKHFDKWQNTGQYQVFAADYMGKAIKNSDNTEDKRIKEKFLGLLNSTSEEERTFFRKVADRLFIRKKNNFGTQMRGDILKIVGLDQQVLQKAWRESDLMLESDDESKMNDNMTALLQLEAHEQGISKVLYEEFGIRDFARYPTDLLIKQYNERNNTVLPYGVAVMPYQDYNGAFYNTKKALGNLSSKLADTYTFRIVEAATPEEATQRLLMLRKRYGKKIDFGLLGGHGSLDSIQLGNLHSGVLNAEDLMDSVWKQKKRTPDVRFANRRPGALIRHIFQPDAPVALESCSTGGDKGIGQKFSELGLHIYAPSIDTSMSLFEPIFDENGKVKELNVKYSDKGVLREHQKAKSV